MPTSSRLEQEERELTERLREVKRAAEEARRAETKRREEIIGRVVMQRVKDGTWSEQQLCELVEPYVKAKRDRDLFDLDGTTWGDERSPDDSASAVAVNAAAAASGTGHSQSISGLAVDLDEASETSVHSSPPQEPTPSRQ